jgi:hypothetical protein
VLCDAVNELLHGRKGRACILSHNLEVKIEIAFYVSIVHQRKLQKLGEAERPLVHSDKKAALVTAQEKKMSV